LRKIILAILVVLAIGAVYLFINNMDQEGARSYTFNMTQYSDSGQEGVVTFTDEGGKVRVTVELSGYSTDVPQPSHIHSGNCPRIGPIIFSLTDVVDNRAETVLDTTFDDLIANNETLNVNVHESYDNFKAYTSCGDIK
jgi:hypothetical protein